MPQGVLPRPWYHAAMRLMLAALVATSVIAVTASVFAIWAGVTDAPWEDDVAAIRCESAHNLREAVDEIMQAQVATTRTTEQLLAMEHQLEIALGEIERYC